MKTANVEQVAHPGGRSELLFSEADLATATGIEAYELRALQPAWFGAPGHWRVCKTGGMVYTVRGVEELAAELDWRTLTAASTGLRYLLRERQEVPSRQLPLTVEALREAAPGGLPRKAEARPWFNRGSME